MFMLILYYDEYQMMYIVKGPKYMLTNIECIIKDYLGQIN